MIAVFGGSDSITASLVVGAFLLGLGLGSLAASVFVDRCRSRTAVLLFVACELGIGLGGLMSTTYFNDVLMGALVPWAGGRAAVFSAAFAGMLVPTLLMGMSLPLLAKALVRDVTTSAVRISWLYAANTFGAAVGAFGAGLWAIGTFGFEACLLGAAILNFGVGVAAAAAVFVMPEVSVARGSLPESAPRRTLPRRIWAWCGMVFVSGFLIIALEIVWFRVVGVIAKGNVYTFPLVLGTFLAADAVGICVGIAVVRRIASPARFFIGLQTLVGLYALLSMLMVHGAMDDWPLRHAPSDLRVVLSITLLLVALPALLLGMSFPIVQRAVQEDPALVGQRVGIIQLSNIMGNAAGSLVTGLLLLHYVGTPGTLRLIGVLALCVTLLLLGRRTPIIKRAVAATGAVALAGLILMFPRSEQFWRAVHQIRDSRLSVHAEDRSGIALAELDAQNARLYVFGHSQSTLPFYDYHIMLGALGPLIHPSAKSVMVIGAGLGATPFAAGLVPSVAHVRVLELIPPVYSVHEQLVSADPESGLGVLRRDPRYTFVCGDGRRDLAISEERFDVIEADALMPRTAGSGLLYSMEFFELVRSRLAPGGLAVQWAPTPRTIDTFVSVFPYVLLHRGVLVGSDQPIHLSPDEIRARLSEPSTVARLVAARLNPAAIADMFQDAEASWDTTTARSAAAGINTDLFPRDEYFRNNR